MRIQKDIHFLTDRSQIAHDRFHVGNGRAARDRVHDGSKTPPETAPVAWNVFLDGRLDQFADVPAVQRDAFPHELQRPITRTDSLCGL